MEVLEINQRETEGFILGKHYAKRKPSISWAFGLYIDGKLEGVLTVGKPASNSLCVGVCGVENSKNVYELNRLCVNEGLKKNVLSKFVSICLRKLKKYNLIIISYADTGMGHTGYIYQATNFLYTGKTQARTDKYMPGNKHSRHYTEEFSHLRKVRSAKHRYVFFTNNKRKMIKELKYKVFEYPKEKNKRYVLGEKIKNEILNKNTGEVFFE